MNLEIEILKELQRISSEFSDDIKKKVEKVFDKKHNKAVK